MNKVLLARLKQFKNCSWRERILSRVEPSHFAELLILISESESEAVVAIEVVLDG